MKRLAAADTQAHTPPVSGIAIADQSAFLHQALKDAGQGAGVTPHHVRGLARRDALNWLTILRAGR
jgi:hypothetical protein